MVDMLASMVLRRYASTSEACCICSVVTPVWDMKLPGPEKINEPELLATQDTEVHAQVNQTKTQQQKNCTDLNEILPSKAYEIQ